MVDEQGNRGCRKGRGEKSGQDEGGAGFGHGGKRLRLDGSLQIKNQSAAAVLYIEREAKARGSGTET